MASHVGCRLHIPIFGEPISLTRGSKITASDELAPNIGEGPTEGEAFQQKNDLAFIRRLASFETLDLADVQALEASCLESKSYERQARIEGPQKLAIQTGFVAGCHTFRDGHRQIVRLYFPGDFLPKHPGACLDLQALSAVELVELDLPLWEVANQRAAVERACNRASTVSEANFHRWVAVLGGRSADVRLAHLLLDAFARLRVSELISGLCFRLPLTQQDLAEIAGLSLVHTNKSLRGLAFDGYVRVRNHQVEIIDLEKLTLFAEFDSGSGSLARVLPTGPLACAAAADRNSCNRSI